MRRTYLALASTWGILIWLMVSTGSRAGMAGFGLGIRPWEYALQQSEAIPHYEKVRCQRPDYSGLQEPLLCVQVMQDVLGR